MLEIKNKEITFSEFKEICKEIYNLYKSHFNPSFESVFKIEKPNDAILYKNSDIRFIRNVCEIVIKGATFYQIKNKGKPYEDVFEEYFKEYKEYIINGVEYFTFDCLVTGIWTKRDNLDSFYLIKYNIKNPL